MNSKQSILKNVVGFLIVGLVVQAPLALGGQAPVTYIGDPTNYTVGSQTVQVYPGALVTLPSGEVRQVLFSGKGTRQKFVAVAKVNVYAILHYLDEPSALNSQDPIGSLSGTQTRMLMLQMMQNLSASDMRSGFEDALDVNDIDINATEIRSLLKQIDFSVNVGDKIFLIGYKSQADAFENLYVYTEKKTIFEKSPSLVTDFWKIWFGVPVDKEMAVCKGDLLK